MSTRCPLKSFCQHRFMTSISATGSRLVHKNMLLSCAVPSVTEERCSFVVLVTWFKTRYLQNQKYEEIFMSVKDALKLMAANETQFVDLRFTDTRGKEQHATYPAEVVDETFFRVGRMFDGSSIAGWKSIDQSDMMLMPDPHTALVDPFFAHPTVSFRCDVLEPGTHKAYKRDPRSLGKRAEKYLLSTGIADAAWFGPEPEFLFLIPSTGLWKWGEPTTKSDPKKAHGVTKETKTGAAPDTGLL